MAVLKSLKIAVCFLHYCQKSHGITSSRCPQLNVTPMLLLSVKPKQGFIGEDYLRITTTNWFRIGMLPWL